MRCKQHLADPSAAVGVCATCLRQRLLSLIDAQSQPLPLPPPSDSDRRNPNLPPHHLPPPPPPLVFPRSVSPYISRRKSDTNPEFADKQRFFSTPQPPPARTKKKSKFRVFSNLFRSGSAKSSHSSDPELRASSNSGRRNSILRLSSLDETGRRGRGMSPDADSEIGCSPDSWKRTPSSVHASNRPSHARVTASPARSQLASGFGFCLSPLMRPSPARHWKGSETGYSGEIRPAGNPHLSTAGSLRANRSRKLADFGRFNHNR